MSCSLSSVCENVMQACCMHVLRILREPWWCRCAFSQDTGNPDVHARRALAMQVCTVRRALTIQVCMLAGHLHSKCACSQGNGHASAHAHRAEAVGVGMLEEHSVGSDCSGSTALAVNIQAAARDYMLLQDRQSSVLGQVASARPAEIHPGTS